MTREGVFPAPEPEPALVAWDEKDEIRRLDLLASVVTPTSLAGIAVAGAFIASGKLVGLADFFLVILGCALLYCAVRAMMTLAFNPLEVVKQGGSLHEVIDEKRRTMERTLTVMLVSIVVLSVFASLCQFARVGSHDSSRPPHQTSRAEFVAAPASEGPTS
jgi:hypothetical protein